MRASLCCSEPACEVSAIWRQISSAPDKPVRFAEAQVTAEALWIAGELLHGRVAGDEEAEVIELRCGVGSRFAAAASCGSGHA